MHIRPHIRDCARCPCRNTDIHGFFAIPVISADNPPDASISFHIIWTFAGNFYFWQSTAKGLAMHCWSWRVEMVSTPLSPAVRFFFTEVWFAMWLILTRNIADHGSFLDLLYTRNTLTEASSFPSEVFLNTAKVSHLTFCRQYDLRLINNVQAANNRIPVLWHFRAHRRLMIQCRLHATTAMNVPASKALKTQSFSVHQQKAV